MTVRGAATAFLLGATSLVGMCGCAGDDDVDIIAECTVTSDPIEIVRPSSGAVFYPSVGRAGGDVFVSWHSMTAEGAAEEPVRAQIVGQWFDRNYVPRSLPLHLGDSLFHARHQWLPRGDGELVAHVWAQHPEDAERGDPLLDDPAVWVARVSTVAPEMVDFDRVTFDAAPRCDGCAAMTLWMHGLDPGPGPLSIAASTAEPAVAFAGIPSECGTEFINYQRVFVGTSAMGAAPRGMGQPLCPEVSERRVSNVWIFDQSDRTGLLFRWGDHDFAGIYYVGLDYRLQPLADPTPVGSNWDFYTSSSGLLPRAVELPNGRVLFTDQRSGLGASRCFTLRLMDADGSNTGDAPWQIPCPRGPQGDIRMTHYVELLATDSGALVVWSERSGDVGSVFRNEDAYSDGAFAVLLTPEGRRGSNVVTLTPDDASLLAPLAGGDFVANGSYAPMAAASAEGAITVVWQEPARGAIFARGLRCE